MSAELPAIPAKRYFSIGEVAELCGVKPHVLRYWEQEFVQLRPVKRRGNRRYYQHHEVLMIRHIRELLYDQGYTISGARAHLGARSSGLGWGCGGESAPPNAASQPGAPADGAHPDEIHRLAPPLTWDHLRVELLSLRELLT